MGCSSSSAKDTKQSTSDQTPAAVAPIPVVVSPAADSRVDSKSTSNMSNMATFGAGCYWGTEKYFFYDFQKRCKTTGKEGKIVKGNVGFMGPASAPPNPDYKDVCSGVTGHVECYTCEFEGGESFYEAMVRFFFQFHDPTTFNKQGNDKGTQYASVIYCYDKKQFEIATKVKAELQELVTAKKITCYLEQTINTDIRMSTIFYLAHKEHQDYLANNPNGYCNHKIRFAEWP